MPDVYATIANVDVETQERLADILELRAADSQMRAMVDSYLSEVEHPPGARFLEIGSGRRGHADIGAVHQGYPKPSGSIRPRSSSRKLRTRGAIANIVFEQGDGRALRFDDDEFDVVVLHTTLCHVPGPERVLAEAFRVLRPGGWLAACDGDYPTITVALADFDPLQQCIEAAKAAFINDVWLVRRLPALLRARGFVIVSSRSYGYLQTTEPEYMLTLVDRGADALLSSGRIGPDLCASLKAEARRRAEVEEFFGFIGFASFIARKP